jgi:hypothetical protein
VLLPHESLRQSVCDFDVCGHVIKFDGFEFELLSEEVVPDLDVFFPCDGDG